MRNKIILSLLIGIFWGIGAVFSQSITGTVFNDANNNGLLDGTEVGVHAVTVTAYDAANTAVSTTTTAQPTGGYTLSGLTAAVSYRIEFSLPTAFNASGNGKTAVQFAMAGETLNLGIYVGSESCLESNPRMIAGCGIGDFFFNSNPSDPSVASWYYNSPNVRTMNYADVNNTFGSDPHDEDMRANQVGIPFGLAVQPRTKLVYMTSVAAPLATIFPAAPDGIGAIYVADYSGAGTTFQGYKLLVNLASLGVTVTGTSFFGKYGLGGADFTQDGKNLFVVNMATGQLIKLDVSGVSYASLPATAPTAAHLTNISIPAPYSSCTGGTLRPVALKEYGGKMYVGAMCDAFTSQVSADLEGRVLTYDYTSNTWGQAFVFQPEAFTAGNMIGLHMTQKPWADPEAGGSTDIFAPVLSDLAFDDTGSLILGITNRKVYNNNSNYETGYVVRTWRNGDGSFTLENGGIVGPYTTATTSLGFIPYIEANIINPYLDGPGNEFFFEQSIKIHPFVYTGGLYVKPGSGEIIWGASDPITVNAVGARYLSLTNGLILRGITFTGQKISRITGTDTVCEGGALEIGNRVWDDSNSNGRQDAGESGLSGVQLTLSCGGSTATTTTGSDGTYYFRDGVGDIATWAGGILPRNTSCTLTVGSTQGGKSFVGNTGGVSDHIDSDGTASGATVSHTFTTGANGENDHTLDFGFGTPPCSINNFTVTPSCNDNGTGNSSTDDYRTFIINVTGTNTATNYNLAVNSGGVLTPTSGSFGSNSTFRLQNGSAGNGTVYTLTVTDAVTGSCQLTGVTVSDPGTCSTPTLGSLQVSKAVTGAPGGFVSPNYSIAVDCSDNSFDQTITLANGGSQTISNIPGGTTCTVTEPTLPAPPSSYSYGTPSISPSGAQTIVASNTTSVTVTNSLAQCTINAPTVSATCNNNGTNADPSDDTFSYQITTTGTNTGTTYGVSGDDTRTGLSYGAAQGPFGSFLISSGNKTITLTDATVAGCTRGSVTIAAPATCSSLTTGSLQVAKTVTGAPSGFVSPNYSIVVDCSDNSFDQTISLANGGSQTITGIPAGTTCTVTEPTQPAPPAGYAYATPSIAPSGAQTITAGGTASVTVTNTLSGVCAIALPHINATCSNNSTTSDSTDDTFTFTIETTGSNTGANYKVERISPAPTTTIFPTLNYGAVSAASTSFSISGGNLSLTLTDNTNSACQRTPVVVTAPATCSGCQTIINCAQVSLSGTTDPTSTPNDGLGDDYQCHVLTVSCPVIVNADLELQKSADKTIVRPGESLTFTLTLINKGPGTASAVQIRDQIPAGVTYVSAAPSTGTYNSTSGIWDLGSIPPGTYTLTITVTVQ